MSKTMRVGWAGVAVLAATLAGAQTEVTVDAVSSRPDALPFAEGSVDEGASKAAICVACHGLNGNSTNPEWPSLAGQSAVYTAEQLRLFRAGIRKNPVMEPMAAPLTDDDIADLAVYYAAQTPSGLEADPSYWAAGQRLYRAGDAARQIPACLACHGPVGTGNPAAGFPALRAQHAVYTRNQLDAYARSVRYAGASDPGQASRNGYMMNTIAQRLTAEDIRNLASYIQGLR